MIPLLLRRMIEAVISDHHKRCRVFNSANISVTDSDNPSLTFDSERFDTDDMHSLTTNTGRLTCNDAGDYIIGASIIWAANATGFRTLRLELNSSTLIVGTAVQAVTTAAVVTRQSVCTLYRLVVGDYILVRVSQNSGGALNVTSVGDTSPEFYMIKVS